MPQSSGVLSDAQIYSIAVASGWKGEDAVIATAVALAESGGRPAVVNYLGCTGLWQVYARVHGLSIERLKDPAYNGQQAYRIWTQQGWKRGWTTYSHGSYLRFMSRARKVAGNPSAAIPGVPNPWDVVAGGAAAAGTAIGTAKRINDAIAKLSDPQTWIRFGLIVLGVIFVIMAVMRMSVTDKTITFAKAAVKIGTKGKI